MATVTKGVRLNEAQQTLLQSLFLHPSTKNRSESDLLTDAAVLGLDILKVKAVLAGGDNFVTKPADLATQLSVELLPIFEFLSRYDALPHWLRAPQASAPTAQTVSERLTDAPVSLAIEEQPPVITTIASHTKAMLSAFGTDLLDDDDS